MKKSNTEQAFSEIYVGCDVGKLGGITLIDGTGRIVAMFQMPMIGTEYDDNAIRDILCLPGIVHVAIEDVHSIQGGKFKPGASSMFSFGYGKGLLKGIAVGLFLPVTLVQAKTWQKETWSGVTKQDDTKKTSLVAAKRLFPHQTFLATERSKVPHSGIVDATLIAEYLRRKLVKV